VSDYIDFTPIPLDPGTLKQLAFQRLADRLPDWAPATAQFESMLIEVIVDAVAELGVIAQLVPQEIIRYLAVTVFGIAPQDPTFATGATTWVLRDTAGYSIPAGTVVTLQSAGDDPIPFRTTVDVTVAPGQAATAAGGVPIVAVDAGTQGSGLTGLAQHSLDFVTSITVVGQTLGGQDGETLEENLDRISRELRLPRIPVLPSHFEMLARNVLEVDRALAIDGYVPGVPPLTGQANAVAVATVNAAGEPLSSAGKAQLAALFQERRGINFLVSVIDATYTAIDVAFTAVAHPGWVVADVQNRAIQAVRDYLDPANWGVGQDADTNTWRLVSTVRRSELFVVLNLVEGLDYVATLTLATQGGTLGTADVTLTGPAPLTRPGTGITGTVTAP
jgi:hypothetical protein